MIDVRALGYIVVQSANIDTWRGCAENVLGMQALDATDGALYVKMDERDFRYLIVPGEADRYFASGWELADAAAFDHAIRALEAAGVGPIRASAQETALRRVQAMVWCTDPSGNRHEFFWGVRADFRRFVSQLGVAGFVTGAMGLGHAVLPAPKFDATDAFLRDVLGFELSDIFRVRFTDDPAEPEKRIHFLHCKNARHHSLAIMDLPVPSGCIHVMAEVDSMDEVGRALDRVATQGVKLSATLGRHCNDHMISFYMKTPGGFDLEYGYGGLTVDWAQHNVYEATRVSLWGHDFSVGFR
ncbi:Iron-dependent extradiol dioxygenase [Paraburkholderia sediminicola]|uniref:Iron-dependent extradiol dioxygenase n=1 Tax=Paraburkholderia sediminicola TaxID=458836 RepID=A0A6J5AHN6_9BURK|nr:VOC family protein [Paraburkholderia sediminicola]CAB3669287.1 Iron-dependent extradiol dioxygenase [Paraburkholderia sediminicola]